MSHLPNLLDAATDLRRSIYASFAQEGFESKTPQMFIQSAQKIIRKNNFDRSKQVKDLLTEAQDKSLEDNKRRENLLMAAVLLQNSTLLLHDI